MLQLLKLTETIKINVNIGKLVRSIQFQTNFELKYKLEHCSHGKKKLLNPRYDFKFYLSVYYARFLYLYLMCFLGPFNRLK